VDPAKKVRRLLTLLRKQCPTVFPVRVIWTNKIRGAWGRCDLIRGPRPFFKIKLLPDVLEMWEWDHIWDLVVHEYAHALGWTKTCKKLKDHGPVWGGAHSLCYEAALRMI